MKIKTLFWQLLPTYGALLVAALAAATFFFYYNADRFYSQEQRRSLEVRCALLAQQMTDSDRPVNQIIRAAAAVSGTRFTFIRADGVVLGDSMEDPAQMTDHSDRLEIQAALRGETGYSVRHSHTLNRRMMYVAVPFQRDGRLEGVLRAAFPTASLRETMHRFLADILLVGVLTAVAALLVCVVVAQRISAPLRTLHQAAELYGREDFSYKIPVTATDEIGQVADAMNRMASKIERTLQKVREQEEELRSVLEALSEGVIAVGMDEQIMSMNRAAAKMLETDAASAAGRPVQEIVRSAELLRFVQGILESCEPDDRELTLYGTRERQIRAYANVMHLGDARTGVLIVMRDVTRIKRLESVRKDFVANVSHELRTPVTSVKGFLETMLESGEEFGGQRGFLEIAARQTDRLNAIIDDLLTLSRLEQSGTERALSMNPCPLTEVVGNALQVCRSKAEDKHIEFELRLDDALQVRGNEPLLEQAVINLIDNAVKYSEPGKRVRVVTRTEEHAVLLEVIDQGCGIDESHLARIFERFYRVDTARSRKLGGTGLGLAIVKHIAACHGGEVTVNSIPGKGSAFTLKLPVCG